MKQASGQFRFGDSVSVDNIPKVLKPLLQETIAAYQEAHGPDLEAIYVHGSAVRGDWQPGVSDLDTVAITYNRSSDAAYRKRRQLIDEINNVTTVVPYVEAYVIDISEFNDEDRQDTLFTLAACGLCVWGKPLNFESYLPPFDDMIDTIVRRRSDWLQGRFAGRVSSTNGDSTEIQTRRFAKHAVRILEFLAVKRGASLHTGLDQQFKDVQSFVPEAAPLLAELKSMLETSSDNVDRALQLFEMSLKLHEA